MQLYIQIPSLPDVVPVEKKMVPPAVFVAEPEMVQFEMLLFVASPIKRMVEVFAVAQAVVFEMVR